MLGAIGKGNGSPSLAVQVITRELGVYIAELRPDWQLRDEINERACLRAEYSYRAETGARSYGAPSVYVSLMQPVIG